MKACCEVPLGHHLGSELQRSQPVAGWLCHSWAYVKEDIVHRECGGAKLLTLRGPESGRVQGAVYRLSPLGHVPVTGF